MLDLYEVYNNGVFIGQCHADDCMDAIHTMAVRKGIAPKDFAYFGVSDWSAELAPITKFEYISPSVDGY